MNKICLITGKEPQEASQEELIFIRHNAPSGMWKMVTERTNKTRNQILYQINQMPDNQDLEIVQAAREILFVVTGKIYKKKHP